MRARWGWVLVGILWLAVVAEAALIAIEHERQSRRANLQDELERIASKLSIELSRYRGLPQVVGTHPALAELLMNPSAELQDEVNQLLLVINEDAGSDALYLIAPDGITVASSNWMAEDSFLGQDLSYRPYFSQAMQGQNSSYFALGTTSGVRGYYFASPLMFEGEIFGVVAVKVSLAAIEQHPIQPPQQFLLTDTNGIIFFSSQTDWVQNSLVEVPSAELHAVMAQRQFGDDPILPLTDETELADLLQRQRLEMPAEGGLKTYDLQGRLMPQENWYLMTLAPRQFFSSALFVYVLVASSVYFMLVFVWLYWRGRIRVEEALRQSRDELEQKVEERTASLQQVQRELIQAEKLAVLGEMSAGINHEINQPLTALKSYAANSLRFAERGDTEVVKQNLATMVQLVEVMSKIVRRFKIFSRKSAHRLGPVSLQIALNDSLDLLQNQLESSRADLQVQMPEQDLLVMADNILLEQVLVNLLNNALQVVQGQSDAIVRLSVESGVGQVLVAVEDNGPGVKPEQREKLFEPFYTTKDSGLGLGLAISQRIVNSFDGQIAVKDSALGGARFEVTLQLASERVIHE